MKTLTNIFILFLLVSIICCTKKNDTTPAQPQSKDYRVRYLGDYYCNGTYTVFSGQNNRDTTMVAHIFMDIYTDSNIYISSITLFPDTSLLKLNADGIFYNYARWRSNDRGLSGNFINDSIYFDQYNEFGGGFPQGFHMRGKKCK
jgi:hypothetical protein